MDAPNLPDQPTFPNRFVFAGGGLAVGLLLGLLLTALLEYRDTTLRGERDIGRSPSCRPWPSSLKWRVFPGRKRSKQAGSSPYEPASPPRLLAGKHCIDRSSAFAPPAFRSQSRSAVSLSDAARRGRALACLQYGVASRRGFVVLTGEVGTGKTTLLKTVLGNFVKGRVPQPSYSIRGWMFWIFSNSC